MLPIFVRVEDLIHNKFPDEKIIRKVVVRREMTSSKLFRILVDWHLIFHTPFSVFLVETERAFYIDRRKQAIVNMVVDGLLGGAIVYGIFSVVAYFQGIPLSLWFRNGWIVLCLLVTMVNALVMFLFPLNNVEVIKHEWVNERNDDGKRLVLQGMAKDGAYASLSLFPWGKSHMPGVSFKYVFHYLRQ